MKGREPRNTMKRKERMAAVYRDLLRNIENLTSLKEKMR